MSEHWVQTSSGQHFDLLDPRPEQISVGDIAHALGQLPRFGGHTLRPYSVAQHCLACLEYAVTSGQSASVQLQALMHDAAEAYIIDLPRPLKNLLPDYKKIERGIENALEQALGLPQRQSVVKKIDELILLEEAWELLSGGPQDWGERERPLNVQMVRQHLSSTEASALFLNAYHRLTAATKTPAA